MEALQHEARAGAVAEARAKAEHYAEATGQKLGDVVSIRAGSSELKVTVRVVWSFV